MCRKMESTLRVGLDYLCRGPSVLHGHRPRGERLHGGSDVTVRVRVEGGEDEGDGRHEAVRLLHVVAAVRVLGRIGLRGNIYVCFSCV